MRYVVKFGGQYANGMRGWTDRQCDAFVFDDEDPAPSRYTSSNAKERAKAHGETFKHLVGVRVVRLKP